jgi:dTDP-3-amino-3,4,6-trideoxy-alpha-D-glucose transaminase
LTSRRSTPAAGRAEGAHRRSPRPSRFILGPHVRAFEEEAAAWSRARQGRQRHGRARDRARALEIRPGDEVICPSFTFYATAESIARRGATPVFAEIDRRRRTSTKVRGGASRRRRGVMPVHLFGRPAARLRNRSSRTRPRRSARRASGRPASVDLQLLPTRTCSPSATQRHDR